MNIPFNGRGFNCERAAAKTETEFIGLHLRTGFMEHLKMADRFLLLKEAYALCLKAVGKELPTEAVHDPELSKKIATDLGMSDEEIDAEIDRKVAEVDENFKDIMNSSELGTIHDGDIYQKLIAPRKKRNKNREH